MLVDHLFFDAETHTHNRKRWNSRGIRWDLIGSKRTLAECATDGIIPNMMAIDRQKVLRQVQAASKK